MKSLLILKNIKVENANAIAGMTYGFPAISNFLGFTHALSRALQKKIGRTLGACAVVCHQHQVHAYRPSAWGDYVFALTRNPLTDKGATAPFNEEGRMHMEVSLLIECDFDSDDFDFGAATNDQNIKLFESHVENQVVIQRLAGGTITTVGRVEFVSLPEDSEKLSKFTRKQLLKLLPGFVLLDRSDLLKTHYESLQIKNPKVELMDAWLDFVALKHQAKPEISEGEEITDQTKATWELIPKPAGGWLVPINAGFKAISPLFKNGEVKNTRDQKTPFRFVESVYSIGEWRSPHRINNLEDIFWRYHADGDWYLCRNNFQPQVQESEVNE